MSEKLSKQFKQGVFQFATGEHVPFGAEYLKSISTTDQYSSGCCEHSENDHYPKGTVPGVGTHQNEIGGNCSKCDCQEFEKRKVVGMVEKNIHFFLCYAKENEDGILVPVDAPQQAKGNDNSFLE